MYLSPSIGVNDDDASKWKTYIHINVHCWKKKMIYSHFFHVFYRYISTVLGPEIVTNVYELCSFLFRRVKTGDCYSEHCPPLDGGRNNVDRWVTSRSWDSTLGRRRHDDSWVLTVCPRSWDTYSQKRLSCVSCPLRFSHLLRYLRALRYSCPLRFDGSLRFMSQTTAGSSPEETFICCCSSNFWCKLVRRRHKGQRSRNAGSRKWPDEGLLSSSSHSGPTCPLSDVMDAACSLLQHLTWSHCVSSARRNAWMRCGWVFASP